MATVHMKVGSLIGEQLLEIAQTNISKGNIEYAMSIYPQAFGMTKEHTLMILKNQTVVVTDEDGEGVNLTDCEIERKANAHNIFDWNLIINNRIKEMNETFEGIKYNLKEFSKIYNGDIENYSIIDMMLNYFNHDQLKSIGIHNIAARIIGAEDSKICDKGSSNPTSIWGRVEDKIRYNNPDVSEYEEILFYTVNYVKLIKILHKEYLKFENTFNFLVENGFIKKPSQIENKIENILYTLKNFSDDTQGYYHPLCNEGLYDYKNKLINDLLKTKYGNEFLKNGIIKKDILDGYDAGWLSPDGEFYGGNGDTSSMIHMNIAEQIFNGNNIYANKMAKDGVSEWSGVDSPEYWLEKHGWVKIHHNDCYGSFIGYRNPKDRTHDFPYAYNPTDIQIKMICDYADKFYNCKFYTEANVIGRDRQPNPWTTYKVRQMDDFKLHEIFER